ncbi:MAG TPA: YicC/YloC family endoribonuclease [Chitinophagales bacterium]|nr:YicC/YloC family endoribonuclease [Chitinophagales bacterium]
MLRSMTGFGKCTIMINGKNFSAELRSLNSKFLDLNLKIPALLREREIDLRSLLSEKLIRGKAELVIELQSGEKALYSINRNAFKKYYSELESLADDMNIPAGNLLDIVMRIPDVLTASGEQLSSKEYAALEKAIDKTVAMLDDFRIKEGNELQREMIKRIARIQKISSEIKKTEGTRKAQIRERLRQKLNELRPVNSDEMRLEQELIFYAERLDITEELVRLESHCSYFLEVIADKEISKGKKLSFITQEIGREINTLGAKANDAPLQKLVVEMKEELEKIKEQVNNVL